MSAVNTIATIASIDTPITATTATLRKEDQDVLSSLIQREPDTVIWGPMDRRSIRINVCVSGKPMTEMKQFVESSLERNKIGKIIIYTNSKVAAENGLKDAVQDILDKHKIEGCAMPFTGNNGIMMKNYIMTSFCPDEISSVGDLESIFCVIGTSAMECGVSSKEVTTGISYGMPRSMYDLYQYLGRVDRMHDALPGQVSFSVILNVPTFMTMFIRAQKQCDVSMRSREERDIYEVLRFLILPTQCYHVTMEHYLEDPDTEKNTEPCDICCPFCDDTYLHFADKLHKDALIRVLQTQIYRDGNVQLINLVSIISDDKKKIKKMIYGAGFSTKSQGKIHGLVLMMIALNIIELIIDETKIGTQYIDKSDIMTRLGVTTVQTKNADDVDDYDSDNGEWGIQRIHSKPRFYLAVF